MFSPLSLDLSPLRLDDDDDVTTFASSTPRRARRSRSEGRKDPLETTGISTELRHRSNSQIHIHHKHSDKRVKVQVQCDVHTAADNQTDNLSIYSTDNKSVSNKVKGKLKEIYNSFSKGSKLKKLLDQTDTHSHKEDPNRIYQPKVIDYNGQKRLTNTTTPDNINYLTHSSDKVNKNLGRYITNTQSILPSRATIMSSNSNTHIEAPRGRERDRSSRAKKKAAASSSASSKMKIIRNRTNSPQKATQPPKNGEFLKAIENSVARSQRAHRMSLYQVPEPDDDLWNIHC